MRLATTALTDEQIRQYHTDGYVIVPNLVSDAEIAAFLDHEARRETKNYGLHGHEVDPQYKYLAHHPRIAGGAMQLLSGAPRIVQTMYLNKAEKGGKGIAMHQDSMYLENEPNTLLACWLALTDTDGGNGGLCMVPGSHKHGLHGSHKNENDKEHASWETQHDMRDRDGRTWKKTFVSFEINGIEKMNVVRLTVPRGAGVFFTGLTIHGSFANTSPDRPRRAMAIHYVHQDTWLFRTDVQNTTAVELEEAVGV